MRLLAPILPHRRISIAPSRGSWKRVSEPHARGQWEARGGRRSGEAKRGRVKRGEGARGNVRVEGGVGGKFSAPMAKARAQRCDPAAPEQLLKISRAGRHE